MFVFSEPHYVFAVAITPDGETVLAGTGRFFLPNEPGFIRYWRVSDGVEVRTMNDQGGGIKAMDLSPDGVSFASAGGNATLKIRHLSDGSIIRSLSGHTGEIFALSYSPDGQMLASSAQDGTVRQWNPNNGQLLRTINAGTSKAFAVDWSGFGRPW
jgi:WD40 repeat protein